MCDEGSVSMPTAAAVDEYCKAFQLYGMPRELCRAIVAPSSVTCLQPQPTNPCTPNPIALNPKPHTLIIPSESAS